LPQSGWPADQAIETIRQQFGFAKEWHFAST
jgi:hypothetical protein